MTRDVITCVCMSPSGVSTYHCAYAYLALPEKNKSLHFASAWSVFDMTQNSSFLTVTRLKII